MDTNDGAPKPSKMEIRLEPISKCISAAYAVLRSLAYTLDFKRLAPARDLVGVEMWAHVSEPGASQVLVTKLKCSVGNQ